MPIEVLTIAFVAAVRARFRGEDGRDLVRGWRVVALALASFAIFYVAAQFAPADAFNIVGAAITIVGAPALASDVARTVGRSGVDAMIAASPEDPSEGEIARLASEAFARDAATDRSLTSDLGASPVAAAETPITMAGRVREAFVRGPGL